jgi:site-specific DNA recombinase
MRAALYLRSSKDRSDVSIDAQRNELAGLAKTRQLRVVSEYADAVESGKDDDRPGFQKLITAIRNERRGWDTLLVLDTSRVARRRHLALMFERDCEQHGIRLVYKSVPETDPVTEMLLKSILQAMDEWHSLTSRAKGLSGMRENVRQGWRAGGRAPLGYRLEHVETGTIREGQPVRKSRLVLSPEAEDVRAFLQARAKGVPRAKAGLPALKAPSQVGIEWNALTYAGHTVWNVHAEAGSGRKRRPRADWVVQRDTHEALITDAEADAILAKLEAYSVDRKRERDSGYLLAGLLVTPDGKPFHGDRGAYRVKGMQMQADAVDRAVAAHVLADLQAPAMVRAVTDAARKLKKADGGTQAMRDALKDAEARLRRVVALLDQTSMPGPLLRQMETIEGERSALEDRLAQAERDAAQRSALANISEHEVRRLLVERAAMIEEAGPESMRDALVGMLARVEITPGAMRIHYRIGRDKVASPRGAEPIPVVRAHEFKRRA